MYIYILYLSVCVTVSSMHTCLHRKPIHVFWGIQRQFRIPNLAKCSSSQASTGLSRRSEVAAVNVSYPHWLDFKGKSRGNQTSTQ